MYGSVSKSDVSDDEEDEEDDDIVELMTTSGRFPKGGTFPRTSPGHSPLLTSRKSPTHYLTGSSDEEMCSVFESRGPKLRNKRIGGYRKRIPNKLVPMDSISSDDGISNGKERPVKLKLRPCNSLPATPADNSGSESLVELLDNLRRQRSGSCRTDSSQSDGGGDRDMTILAKSKASNFDDSDEECSHVAMETDTGTDNGEEVKRTNTTLRSIVCAIL